METIEAYNNSFQRTRKKPRAAELRRYSDKAIRRKIEDGVWREGAVWLPGADGGRQKALMEAVFGKQEERKVG